MKEFSLYYQLSIYSLGMNRLESILPVYSIGKNWFKFNIVNIFYRHEWV